MKEEDKTSQTNLPEIDKLWDYSNPKETALKFKELLHDAEKSGNQFYRAELLTQLARTQSLQRAFSEAHLILDSVQKMLSTQEMPVPEIRYLLERGRTYNSNNEQEKAIPLFKAAYEKAVINNEDFYAIDALHMLGIADKPQEQLTWNLLAMELAEKSNNRKATGWLGPLYNNIGWTYHDMQDYSKALLMFEKSLAWRIEHKDEQGIFIAKWCLGRANRSLNRIDEALQIQKQLAKEIEDKNVTPDGYVYEELAECLLLQGKIEEAKTYFWLAYELLSKDEWLKANEQNRLERLLKLGKG